MAQASVLSLKTRSSTSSRVAGARAHVFGRARLRELIGIGLPLGLSHPLNQGAALQREALSLQTAPAERS